MSIISDILSGKLFKFRTATGADVNTGTSDKLLVTPKSIKDSSFGSAGAANETVAVMPFSLANLSLLSGSINFALSEFYQLTPDTGNGYFYTGRGNVFTARLFVYAKIDISGSGEACLWNVTDNVIVSGSTVSFAATQYNLFKSADFTMVPNKVYTVAVRRSSAMATIAYVRSALVTIKIPKA